MKPSLTDWGDSTIIDADKLGDYIYDSISDADSDNVIIEGYSVQVGKAGFKYEELETFIRKTFVDYVFDEEEQENIEGRGDVPELEALDKAGFKEDFQRDGNLGEFFLFLIVDGFLDIPMITHKVVYKQNYKHEVYGSDNMFFGSLSEYEDVDLDEVIGVGEAKVYSDLNKGLKNAIESIEDFHDESSRRSMDQELSITPANLSDNLDEDHFDYLRDIMVKENYHDIPIFHPIFICHPDDELRQVEDITKAPEDIRDEIDDILENKDYLKKASEKASDGHHRLDRAYLFFIFLPVDDLDEFRKRMVTAINPNLTSSSADDSDNEEGDE